MGIEECLYRDPLMTTTLRAAARQLEAAVPVPAGAILRYAVESESYKNKQKRRLSILSFESPFKKYLYESQIYSTA